MRRKNIFQITISFLLGMVFMSVFSIIHLFKFVSIPTEYKGVHALSCDTASLKQLINRRSDKTAVGSSYRTGDHFVHGYNNNSVGDTAQTSTIVNSKFAYGFYAVSEKHLIAAMVNVNRLRRLSVTKADFVILTNVKTNLNISNDVRLTPYSQLRSPQGYYTDCFTKLIFFNMTQYERVIFLDVDVLVLKPLDSLFRLPDVPIASPIAYWLDPPMFTAAFLVIKLNVTLFDVFVKKIDDIMKINLFDMDLFNFFYRHKKDDHERYTFPELLLLPGYFLTMSPHLGTNKIEWNDQKRPKNVSSPFLDQDKLNDVTHVVHFSGGPKPWDLQESVIRQGSANLTFWQKYNLEFKNEFNDISRNRLRSSHV